MMDVSSAHWPVLTRQKPGKGKPSIRGFARMAQVSVYAKKSTTVAKGDKPDGVLNKKAGEDVGVKKSNLSTKNDSKIHPFQNAVKVRPINLVEGLQEHCQTDQGE